MKRGGYTRGREPSCGGSRSIDDCQRCLLAGSVRGVGGTRPPRLSPEGKRERGDQIPCAAGYFFGVRVLRRPCRNPIHALRFAIRASICRLARCISMAASVSVWVLVNRSSSAMLTPGRR